MINRNRIIIHHKPHTYISIFNSIIKSFATSPLSLPDTPITPCFSTITPHHKTLCFSLAETLINRGLLSAAQCVIQRLILHSPTVADEIPVIDFAVSRGVEPEFPSYCSLITRLVNAGEFRIAEDLYIDRILTRGIKPDALLLGSMMICYCKLGKIKDENDHVQKLVELKSSSSVRVFSELIKEVFEQNRFLDAYEYCVMINDAGVLLSVSCYNMLITEFASRGYVDEARQVFDIMRERGVPPVCHLWKSLVFGFCKMERVEEAELLSMEMESYGFFVDKAMYTSLINGYCKNRKVKMGMRVFLRMLKMGCQPDTYTYNTLMQGFVNCGIFDKMWILHGQMIELGLEPDVLTYQIMINKFFKEDKVDSALALLNSMTGRDLIPNVHCYTPIVPALFKENRVEVDEVYQKMLDSGVIPDQVMFFKLMKECPKGYELHLTLKFLQAIAKYGCGIDPLYSKASFGPTESIQYQIDHLLGRIVEAGLHLANMAYSIYIIGLCFGGKSDDALHNLVFMINLGFQPLISAYNSLVKCFSQEGFVEHSGALIELMEGTGMIPNSATLLVMVNEHCKYNDLASAFSVLRLMDDRRMKPSVAIYDCIIGCLGREKRVLDAHRMFKTLLESGVDPDDGLYFRMINAYSKNGQAIQAGQLFKRMMKHGIQPDSHIYSSLISGFVKKNMMDKSVSYLGSMLKDGFMPNKVLYTSLIDHFLRKGELKFAFRLISLMERRQIECDHVTYITLISGICRNLQCYNGKWHDTHNRSQEDREHLYHLLRQNSSLMEKDSKISITTHVDLKLLAMKLIRGIKDSFYTPNLYLYNGILSGFCRMGKFEEAYAQLDLMEKHGVGPNQVTFTILINGHIQVGETDAAVGLFNKMNADGCVPDRILYNILIKGFCKNGRLLDALSLSHAMCKRGFVPSKIAYEYMLISLCSSRLVNEALTLCEDMISYNYLPCRHNGSWLLHMLVNENKVNESQMVHDLMFEKGRRLSNPMRQRNLMGS
ncbi:pentatricopeptide repeat-containing protein At5g62370-like [Bidens hawaiensis]|uniref:pentatricopeptide repeat-containing protein At5g62370-like n=1 Tax=Bidens hawaiensis TaxID=980011 RepID=UPI0040490B26